MLAAEEACDRQGPEPRAAQRPQERRAACMIAADDDVGCGAFRPADGLLPARSPGVTLIRARQRRAALELEPDRRGLRHAGENFHAEAAPHRGLRLRLGMWKMKEDLSGPYPGYGLGALDAYDGYVSYRMLDETALSREIADMRELIER
jgi:hypothetical protein